MLENRGWAANCLAKAILDRARAEAVERNARLTVRSERDHGPIGAFKRKMLLHEARGLAERYNLQEEVQGWVYAAERVALTGLEVVDLYALVTWLRRASENIETVCDRADMPPAR